MISVVLVQLALPGEHSPVQAGVYLYSGYCLTTEELGRAIKAHQEAGHTHGESRGA